MLIISGIVMLVLYMCFGILNALFVYSPVLTIIIIVITVPCVLGICGPFMLMVTMAMVAKISGS